ncbi:cobalt-precorrin-6A reductase [Yoonia sp. MH D7]
MTILLLAGTREAVAIASGLVSAGLACVASVAGDNRAPHPVDVSLRIGGFGGVQGFERYLNEVQISAVVDATHPYATKITNRTAAVCTASGLPYLQVLRPQWEPQKGDNWTEIACEEDAARFIPEGAVVFLGTGSADLHRYAALEGRRVICRQIGPPTASFPFEGGEFLIGRPPFPVEREMSVFEALGVEWIVVKNAGGEASATKLVAARRLGIPVLMIARPKMPDAPRVDTAEAAVSWAMAL